MNYTENPKTRISEQRMFFILLCIIWTYQALLNYLGVVLSRIPLLGTFFQYYFRPILLILFILLSLPYIAKQLNVKDFLFTIGVLIFVCITLLINSKYNQEFINNYLPVFLLQAFPLYYIGRSVTETLFDENEVKILGTLSLICLLSTILVILRDGANIQEDWSGSMYYPYIMLPHLLLILYIAVNYNSYKRILYSVVFVFGFLFMVMLGNRGSLICAVTFLLVTLYKSISRMKTHKKIILFVLIFALALFFIESRMYDLLLNSLYNFASTHGLSLRLYYFLEGQINEPFDSGRSVIRQKVIQAIKINPLGYGLSSDVYFANAYVHNIFLEFWIDFGILFGSIFIGAILFITGKTLFNPNLEWRIKNIFWIYICCSIIKLCISGTYLKDPYIFFMIGLGISLGKVGLNTQDTITDMDNYSLQEKEYR